LGIGRRTLHRHCLVRGRQKIGRQKLSGVSIGK
jgi:hypothetical protein